MLLNNFSQMTATTSPNRVGVVDGGTHQHGRTARGGIGGGGAVPVGQAGGKGAHPRRAVRDDGVASQACGARTSATQDGRGRNMARAPAHAQEAQARRAAKSQVVAMLQDTVKRKLSRLRCANSISIFLRPGLY